MEKRKPHFSLSAIHQQFSRPDGYRITVSAEDFAIRELDLDEAGVRELVQAVRPRDFVKSMTSYRDHRVWQDVYTLDWSGRLLYVKFTEHPSGDGYLLLISLKDK